MARGKYSTLNFHVTNLLTPTTISVRELAGEMRRQNAVACRELGYQYGIGCESFYLDYVIVIVSVLFRLLHSVITHALH